MIAPGTMLCDIEIGSSLDELVARFSSPEYAGTDVVVWCFDGIERRQAARDVLVSKGVTAHVRSAYKPLVHAMLEEDVDFNRIKEIRINYRLSPVFRKTGFCWRHIRSTRLSAGGR
ncbi:MAG: hypothetical protein GY789_25900 [Hyphomicrobiales bacterium]|nr:hypothetical protein [Hyphomicrobiales bacterium]